MCLGILFSSVTLHTGGANSKISDKEHEKNKHSGETCPNDSPGRKPLAYLITKTQPLYGQRMVGSGLLTGFLLHIVVLGCMLLLFLPIPISPVKSGVISTR